MRIAFDVKGTLIGHNQDKVVRLFRALQSMGHEMYIWSNSISYAFDAVSIHKLSVDAEHILYKYSSVDAEMKSLPIMDVAIDDELVYKDCLAANLVVDVRDVPDTYEEFASFIENMLKARL